LYRGFLNDDFIEIAGYKDTDKDIMITQEFSHFFWLENIVKKNSPFELEAIICDYLKILKEQVQRTTQRPFIYYIGYRKKVRFHKIRRPLFSREPNLKIQLVVGDVEVKKITFKIPDFLKDFPIIKFNSERISFIKNSSESATFDIHSFLSNFDINLGLNTEIGYIGKTINPESRPIKRKHRGLTDIIYNKIAKGNDIFIFYNQFKMNTSSSPNKYNVVNYVGTSYFDDIGAENEGLFLEKALISYFKLNEFQSLKSEEKILNNSLLSIAKKINVRSLRAHLGFEGNCEYFNFFSREIAFREDHIFECLFEDKAIVREVESIDQLMTSFFEKHDS